MFGCFERAIVLPYRVGKKWVKVKPGGSNQYLAYSFQDGDGNEVQV